MTPLHQIKSQVQSALCAYQQKLNFKHPQDIPRAQWENQVSTHRNILELQRRASELAAGHGYRLWFTHGCPHLLKDGVDCLRVMFDAEPDETAVEYVAAHLAQDIDQEFYKEAKRLARSFKGPREPRTMRVVFAAALSNLAARYLPNDAASKKLFLELRRI
jgi:hypothetical protein